MNLTKALRSYASTKGWCPADADDAAFKSAISANLASGELTPAKFAELSADAPTGVKTMIERTVADALAPFAAMLAKMTGAPDPKAAEVEAAKALELKKQADAKAEWDLAVQKSVAETLAKAGIAYQTGATPASVFGGHGRSAFLSGGSPDATKALARFDNSRTGLSYRPDNTKNFGLFGQAVKSPGTDRQLNAKTAHDKAVCGAYFKWAVGVNHPNQPVGQLKMTDLDWQIMREVLHEHAWSGTTGLNKDGLDNEGLGRGFGVENQRLDERTVKALLDDSTSGGITMVPQVFDDAIIQTPLLMGELFPFITVENLAMGRRIEAPTMARVTLTSGIAESTNIPLFDTTGFVGALDTQIYNVVGAIEIGADFQEDTPIENIGGKVVENYGEAARQYLDNVIAVGDGSTQPLGIFNTSGVVSVGAANPAAGPVTMGDLEGLMFGVNKAFRTSRGGTSNMYVGTETTYRRVRGIPVGSAYNARVMGVDYGDYSALGVPFKIAINGVNNQTAYCNMAWYKMYRRLGGQLYIVQPGNGYTTTQRHVTLIAWRGRYGGRLQLGGACSVMGDLQS